MIRMLLLLHGKEGRIVEQSYGRSDAYYRIEAAAPGYEELTGHFDRNVFHP